MQICTDVLRLHVWGVIKVQDVRIASLQSVKILVVENAFSQKSKLLLSYKK